MRIQKVYLETTLFNFYVDKDRDANAYTVKLFREIAAGKYEAFTSTYVTEELENAPEEKKPVVILGAARKSTKCVFRILTLEKTVKSRLMF
jgi:hypothetical protein